MPARSILLRSNLLNSNPTQPRRPRVAHIILYHITHRPIFWLPLAKVVRAVARTRIGSVSTTVRLPDHAARTVAKPSPARSAGTGAPSRVMLGCSHHAGIRSRSGQTAAELAAVAAAAAVVVVVVVTVYVMVSANG